MDRRPPSPGQIWRHYKGNEYEIDYVTSNPGEGKLIRINDGDRHLILGDYIHTETQKKIYLLRDAGDRCYYMGDRISPCTYRLLPGAYVIYGGEWARPLENFMEVLGDIHDPLGGTQFYRFELLYLASSY